MTRLRRLALPLALAVLAAQPARALSLDETFRSKLSVEDRDKTRSLPLDKVVSRLDAGQKAAAKADLARYRSSKDLGTLQDVAKGYLMLGSQADALAVAENMKTLYPNDPAGYRIAADACYRMGSYQETADQAAAALQRNPKDANALTLLKLAQSQGARADTAAAARAASDASAQAPQAGMAQGERPLGRRERQQIEAALLALARTQTGRQILQDVMSKTGGGQATLAGLSANGVDVRAADGAKDAFAKVRMEGDSAVIAMPKQVLEHKPAERSAAAASTGEALEQAVVIRKEGAGFSFVVMKEKTVLYAIHVYEELKSSGQGCSEDSVLCQSWRLLSRIWEDNLSDNPPQPGELSGGFQEQLMAAQRDETQANVKGTKEIDGNMFMANLRQDAMRGITTPRADDFRRQLDDKDKKFREELGYPLMRP